MPRILASRQFELELLTTYSPLVGMDEVGRGALAGPVAVGACAITGSEGEAPSGLADSKLLSAKKREELAPQVRSWAAASAVAWASNEEIDRFGIIVGLRLAGMRALARIEEKIGAPALVLLDGSHDWLTPPEDLFASLEGPEMPDVTLGEVMTRVKADAQCTLVAAASVIAKVARDEHMTKLEDPGYGWASNKGYSSPQHVAGLKALGPSFAHRRSWSLPGI
ncbi:ribonuclease HII [Schaalia cardiffensis]|uniref:Ribonuclease n=1 Tax=Schaalia cardiffensis F0333 TaxID=888050 RepID=N6X944_9ACTO|nr:ribonuclease HII [Schaalia cardiffensis]ENO17658.1 ribonuclease HII [Schaalia cardiffensis F0333]MBJ2328304.1 ribonuclease HII [Schaalia cardiffensis]